MRFLVGIAPLLCSPLLLACGARSGLPEGAGGHPAGTTTSATTTTAATGTGGAPALACHLLQPVLTVDDAGLGDVAQPNLVTLSTSPPSAALVFASRPAQGPTSLARALAFDGWGEWPPSLGASETLEVSNKDASGILVIAATRREPPPSDVFSLLTADELGDLTFEAATSPGSPGLPVVLGGSVTALGIASNGPPTTHVVMTTFPEGPYTALLADYGEATAGAASLGATGATGCATTAIAADAAGSANGWIFGVALGTELIWNSGGSTPCEQNFLAIGPATHLRFTTLPWGTDLPPVAAFEAGGTVERLRMMPRSDGAWAVWTEAGSGTLNLLRVGPGPGIAAGPTSLVDTDALPGSFDVEHLGDTLVIGQVVEQSSSAPQVRVHGWTGDGPTWSVDIPLEGALAGPVELLASDGADSLLVAWSELAPGAAFHRVRIARLDCTP
jgi:hypothetical protein